MIDLDEMVRGYATAALWADCIPLAAETSDDWESGGLEHLEFQAGDESYIRDLCAAFLAAADPVDIGYYQNNRATTDYTVSEALGHDLRLSSGGHGTGLWDRGLGAVGDRLHELATSRPFSRISGGDVWQTSDTHAQIEHYDL